MVKDDSGSETVPTTLQRLAAPFAVSEHATVKKGGSEQTYAPWTEYVERMNNVLDKDWSFRVIREGFTATECWVLGEIEVVIDGEKVVRQQYGCEPIAIGQSPNGDLLKKAASDAVKKAASLFGTGLYLSIKEEREAIKAEMQKTIQAAAKAEAEKRRNMANRPKPEPTSDEVDRAARMTGAPPETETTEQRWQRLVAEAEQANLDTIKLIKAIDPKACGEAQMKRHAERLEARLKEVRAA